MICFLKVDFSPYDDDVERAKKYERLGLLLLNNSPHIDENLKRRQISCSFKLAFMHLAKLRIS